MTAGTLQAGINNAIPGASAVILTSGASLDMNGKDWVNCGTINLNSGHATGSNPTQRLVDGGTIYNHNALNFTPTGVVQYVEGSYARIFSSR